MLARVIVLVLLASCSASFLSEGLKKIRNGVHLFEIPEEEAIESVIQSKVEGKAQQLIQKARSSMLLRGAPLGAFRPQNVLPLFGLKPASSQKTVQDKAKSPLKLKDGFKIENCTGTADKATFVIKKLDITPDPVEFPGTITFQFDIDVTQDISALKIDLDLKVKERNVWIHVPCIGDFGSCSYDVCERLQTVTDCPPELTANKVPCHCPFNKNTYKVPGISAEIDAEVFVPAEYNATATMTTSNGEFVGCYTASFTIED